MALPALAARLGRKVYRDAKGRFTSKAKFELATRRSLVTGRFLTKQAAKTERRRNAWLTQKLGRPPAGQDWLKIATKYGDRFSSLTSEMNSEI